MKIQEIYAKKRTPFISRLNINARQLLNRSRGLHLNEKGTTRLAHNYKKVLI